MSCLLLAFAVSGQIEPVTDHQILLTVLPATVQAPAGADDYTWFVPSGVTITEDTGASLTFTAKQGTYLIRCKTLSIDWDAKQLNSTVHSAIFVIAAPTPDPDGDDDDDDDDPDPPDDLTGLAASVRKWCGNVPGYRAEEADAIAGNYESVAAQAAATSGYTTVTEFVGSTKSKNLLTLGADGANRWRDPFFVPLGAWQSEQYAGSDKSKDSLITIWRETSAAIKKGRP